MTFIDYTRQGRGSTGPRRLDDMEVRRVADRVAGGLGSAAVAEIRANDLWIVRMTLLMGKDAGTP